MAEITLKGHKVVKGKAEGEALVSDKAFAFMGLVNMTTGEVIEKDSPIYGKSIAGNHRVGNSHGDPMLVTSAKPR